VVVVVIEGTVVTVTTTVTEEKVDAYLDDILVVVCLFNYR